MIVDCSEYCGGYSRDGREPIFCEGYSVSEDHKVEAQLFTDKGMTWFAALQVQDLAKIILRGESSQGWTDANGSAAFPTTRQLLEGIFPEIVGQLKWQQTQGIHGQQQELFKKMTSSVLIAWWLEEKRSEEICANQPESGSWKKTQKRQSQKRHRNRPSRYHRSRRWQRSRSRFRHRKNLAKMSKREWVWLKTG